MISLWCLTLTSYGQLSSAPQLPKTKVLLNIWILRIGTVFYMEIQISIQKYQSPLESIFKKPLILKASNMATCSTHARKCFSCALHLRFIKQTSRNIQSRAGQRIVEADQFFSHIFFVLIKKLKWIQISSELVAIGKAVKLQVTLYYILFCLGREQYMII